MLQIRAGILFDPSATKSGICSFVDLANVEDTFTVSLLHFEMCRDGLDQKPPGDK